MAVERENEPEPPPQVPPSRQGPRARRGRRIAQFAYYAAMAAIAVASTTQITRQVFFPPAPSDPYPFDGCRGGLAALYQAIEAGRTAAEHGDDADEEAALVRYRDAVAPVWRYRDAVAASCRADEREIAALDAIERLRYSEEHSVRHQAVELTALRRHVRELVGAEPARR